MIRLSRQRGIPLVLLAVSLGAGVAWQAQQPSTGASTRSADGAPGHTPGHTPDAATPHGPPDSTVAPLTPADSAAARRAAHRRWRTSPEIEAERRVACEAFEASLVTRTGERVIVRTPNFAADYGEQTDLLKLLDARVAEMKATLDLPPGAPITIINYPDFETMGRCTGRILPEWADLTTSTVHRVMEHGGLDGDGIAEAEILLTRALGPLPDGWFRAGALTWLADRWLGAPLRAWDRTYPESRIGFEMADVARIVEEETYLLAWPLAGIAVHQLLGEQGAAGLAALAKAVRRNDAALATRLSALAFRAPSPAAPAELSIPRWQGFVREPGVRGQTVRLPYLRGVCLAHDNTLESGYASAHAGENLAYLAEKVGANAISVSPFGYIGGAHDPIIHHPYKQRGAIDMTQETDESLLSVIQRAQNVGQVVILAPHLWGRVWCGEWGADSTAAGADADWPRFFAEYRRFILHYAALAEHGGANMLQIGKELGATTHREAEWRRLIADIRRVYHGPIVYGANWDGEQHRIAWWDAVDYIGISQYTPLSEAEDPSLEEMTAAARRVAAELDTLSVRVGRPWLLTEIGFIAGSTAARRPWETYRDAGATPDLELQARCYEAALTAFQESSRSAGLLFWKWFTDLESNNAGRTVHDFPPYGKPAEVVLAGAWRMDSDYQRGHSVVTRRAEGATGLRVFRGLPHPGEDQDAFNAARIAHKHFRIGNEVFYQQPETVSDKTRKALRDWVRNLEFGGRAGCGFHADWLLELTSPADTTNLLICLGCNELEGEVKRDRLKFSGSLTREEAAALGEILGPPGPPKGK